MTIAGNAPQAVESVRTAIVLFAIASVVFWKMLLKIIVMGAVIILIVLLTSGAIVLLENIHRVTQ